MKDEPPSLELSRNLGEARRTNCARIHEPSLSEYLVTCDAYTIPAMSVQGT